MTDSASHPADHEEEALRLATAADEAGTDEPAATEPTATEPTATEPTATEPVTTEPGTLALDAEEPASPPRRRRVLRRAMLGALAVVVLAMVAATGVLGAPFAASIWSEFGYHPAEDARAWAARPLAFAAATTCAACHGRHEAEVAVSRHAGVSCSSCHGPLAAHLDDPENETLVESPPDATACLACHRRELGRPALIAQVEPATHFAAGVCVTCHDPHDTTAATPPTIGHALANLPACATCHAAQGIEPWPPDHLPAPDTTCLTCHHAAPSAEGATAPPGAAPAQPPPTPAIDPAPTTLPAPSTTGALAPPSGAAPASPSGVPSSPAEGSAP